MAEQRTNLWILCVVCVTLTIRLTLWVLPCWEMINHVTWKWEYGLRRISALCLFDKKDIDMKNPQKSNYLCSQPFSFQKNEDLHTSSSFANLSLRWEKKPTPTKQANKQTEKPKTKNTTPKKNTQTTPKPPQDQIQLPTNQNKTTAIPPINSVEKQGFNNKPVILSS